MATFAPQWTQHFPKAPDIVSVSQTLTDLLSQDQKLFSNSWMNKGQMNR